MQNYFNFPWDYVLKYTASDGIDEDPDEDTGLAVDGICGPETWAAISEIVKDMPTIRYDRATNTGSTGWHVTMLQAFLNYLGADLDADSEYGPLSQDALITFQMICKGGDYGSKKM